MRMGKRGRITFLDLLSILLFMHPRIFFLAASTNCSHMFSFSSTATSSAWLVAVTFAVCMSLPPLSINFLFFFFLVIVLIQLFWSLASLIWIFGCWNQEDICPKKPFIFQRSSFPLTPKEVSQEVKSVNSFSYPSWGSGFCWASIPEDHEFYQGMIAITQATSHLDLFSKFLCACEQQALSCTSSGCLLPWLGSYP